MIGGGLSDCQTPRIDGRSCKGTAATPEATTIGRGIVQTIHPLRVRYSFMNERRRRVGPAVAHELEANERALPWHSPLQPPAVVKRHKRGERPLRTAAREALERLIEGNQRFVSGMGSVDGLSSRTRRAELVAGQQPFAIVLGCSDSRVPAEIVFDQGLGDLFVIRVAGNVVAPSQIGSVEFAAERFGTRLVVVLGHSQCGAVLATLEELRQPQATQSRNLRSIVDRIRPSVEGLLATELGADLDALVFEAVRANVRVSANQLRHGSEILERLIAKDGLVVVGAEYSLETGIVNVFDGAPEAG
jgi:carbonic anhydrase